MTRWDLVYKWSDPETQSLVDAVTSALENCDRKLSEARAAAPDAPAPTRREAEAYYEGRMDEWKRIRGNEADAPAPPPEEQIVVDRSHWGVAPDAPAPQALDVEACGEQGRFVDRKCYAPKGHRGGHIWRPGGTTTAPDVPAPQALDVETIVRIMDLSLEAPGDGQYDAAEWILARLSRLPSETGDE